MIRFYIDTCIWLNLFKKEGDSSKGVPYWKIADDFIKRIMFSEDKEIIYNSLILKELKFKLGEISFNEKLIFLKSEKRFKFIKSVDTDYSFARKLEGEFKYEIGFFDCLHIAICKRTNSILITRDKELIKNAIKYITVNKPEQLFT
tara:strand:+ start:770 stop:1207 length:438 start_codon:yes stop_codon:yes gene_type:complete